MKLDYVELPEDLFILGKGRGKEARKDGEQGKKEGRKRKDKREVAMQSAFLSHLVLLAWPQLDGLTDLSTT